MSYEFYKFLDLPPVPSYLIDSVDLDRLPDMPVPDRPMQNGIFAQRHLKNWNGYDYKAAANVRTLHPEYETWVSENITADFADATINWTMITEQPAGLPSVSSGAHTDTSRDFTLIFLLKTGGDHVRTVFFQEQGQPLLRKPRVHGENLSTLSEISEVVIPLHTWCALDSRVLHSVEGLTDTRVAFQIGLYHNPWQDIWNTLPDPGFRDPVTKKFQL